VHEPLVDPHKERKEAYKNNEEVQEKKTFVTHTYTVLFSLVSSINQSV